MYIFRHTLKLMEKWMEEFKIYFWGGTKDG